jgi:hypothetical protein
MGATDKYASTLRKTMSWKSRASIKYPNDLRLPFNVINMLVRRRPTQRPPCRFLFCYQFATGRNPATRRSSSLGRKKARDAFRDQHSSAPLTEDDLRFGISREN